MSIFKITEFLIDCVFILMIASVLVLMIAFFSMKSSAMITIYDNQLQDRLNIEQLPGRMK